jgi:diguanylate cyclase (GGDEF)-like protein/putative nucleotidyltransferase with HDIG domain
MRQLGEAVPEERAASVASADASPEARGLPAAAGPPAAGKGERRQGEEDPARRSGRRAGGNSAIRKRLLSWQGGLPAQWVLLTAAAIAAAALAALPAHLQLNPYLSLPGLALLLILAALGILQVVYARQTHRLSEAYQRAHLMADLNSAIISSLVMAVDAKDQHTHGHTERVRDLAVLMGEEMGLSEDELEAVKMAAMLHDIGKLAVPDYILSKPDTLTQEEMRKVQTHTLVGAALLEPVKFPWPVVPIIRSHHEWFDGHGYPDGLAGEQVPLSARILAVADVYDALLSNRPYRPAMTVQEAVGFMRDRSGTQFDPLVLETCFRVLSAKQYRNRFGFIFDADATEAAAGATDTPGRRSIFRDIKQAHQELLALYEIVQTMSQSLNVEETLELVISKTKRIIDFATCVLFLSQAEDDSLVAATAAGPYADAIRGRRLLAGQGVTGAAAQSGKTSGLGRPAAEDLEHLLGPAAQECPLTQVISAPLASEAGCVGALTVYRTSDQPFTEDDLRLASAVARQTAIAIRNARNYEQTKKSALTDQLTGLANARYFFMHLEQELSRAEREGKPVSLIAIDLNGLKQVNDNFGHQQGDRVLRMVADVFRRHVRNYDTVVRYAGDEFFIILPDTTNQVAVETANRIKRAVRETSLEVTPERVINLSASFGVATYPGDAKVADGLIAAADRAMYADKRLTQQAALLSAAKQPEETGKSQPAGTARRR